MARSLSQVLTKVYPTAVIPFTGAAPQVANGNTFDTRLAARDSLSAHILYNILTNTITFTAQWQVSDDGSVWVPCKPSNAAADVIFATGNAGQVTARLCLVAPSAVYGFRYCRLIITTGVGVGQGAAKDDALISYSFCKSGNGS